MRIRNAFLLLPLVLALPIGCGAQGKAQDAAKAWLALNDAGQYGASWDSAAAFFKAAVPRSEWEHLIGSARGPLGAPLTRTLKTSTYTRTLPGAPAGEYVVIQYQTSFEHKPSAVETITPMREPDGSWRVSGYFVR